MGNEKITGQESTESPVDEKMIKSQLLIIMKMVFSEEHAPNITNSIWTRRPESGDALKTFVTNSLRTVSDENKRQQAIKDTIEILGQLYRDKPVARRI